MHTHSDRIDRHPRAPRRTARKGPEVIHASLIRTGAIGPRLGVMLIALFLVPVVQAGPMDPLPPVALTADSTGGDVVLSWEAPAGDVDGYRIYRADDIQDVVVHGLDAFRAIGETTALTFVDPGQAMESGEEGRALYFVTALLGDGESVPSNPVGQYPHCWQLRTECLWPPA